MAQVPGGLANPAQLAAFLAAAAVMAPAANAPAVPPAQGPPAQLAQGAAPDQANIIAQMMQAALQSQQAHAQPAPWAGLAQLSQPQPAQQAQPALEQPQPCDNVHEQVELEYRNARSAQLDKTLALFMRAAQSSNMTRYAILQDMNGRHGHSAEWWRTYYLIFADDIDRFVKAGTDGTDTGSHSSATSRKTISHPGTLRPVLFPSVSSSPSSSRKRKAPLLSHSPDESDPEDGGDVRSHPSARRISRRLLDEDEDDTSLDQPHAEATPSQRYVIPDSLPEHQPTAPTNTSCVNGRTAFTEEDIAYFVHMILWHVKNNPSVGKRAIMADICRQATHHSEQSWLSFWTRVKGRKILTEGQRMAALARLNSTKPEP
ncbi:unnamed protein product [Peniophora sp. CBMAI 1063]|nr:unnamed protein product [Peniophora sp. CBMAI 1063]